MKILLGIDSGTNANALHLTKRLRFWHATFDLAQVVPFLSAMAFATSDQSMMPYADVETI